VICAARAEDTEADPVKETIGSRKRKEKKRNYRSLDRIVFLYTVQGLAKTG
jgi:hypothetical protein